MSSNFSPNVYRTLGEALETFRWFDEAAEWDKHFEWWERYLVRDRLQEKLGKWLLSYLESISRSFTWAQLQCGSSQSG